MFYKFVFWFCTQACDVDSPHAFAPLTCRCSLTLFLFGLLCFINLFLSCARKRAMWIHLTRSLRSPAVVH